jgi:hypothetical protein
MRIIPLFPFSNTRLTNFHHHKPLILCSCTCVEMGVCVSSMSFNPLRPLRLNVDGRQPNVLSPVEKIPTLVSEMEVFSKMVQQQAVRRFFFELEWSDCWKTIELYDMHEGSHFLLRPLSSSREKSRHDGQNLLRHFECIKYRILRTIQFNCLRVRKKDELFRTFRKKWVQMSK